MPRKIIEKIFPSESKIRNIKIIKLLGSRINNEYSWHLDRKTVSSAVAIGMFIGWLPIPIQMLSAAAAAIVFKANIPIAVSVAWFSNPITMPFLFTFAYILGSTILGTPVEDIDLEVVFHNLGETYATMFLGCFILGVVSAALGYSLTHMWWTRETIAKRNMKNRQP